MQLLLRTERRSRTISAARALGSHAASTDAHSTIAPAIRYGGGPNAGDELERRRGGARQREGEQRTGAGTDHARSASPSMPSTMPDVVAPSAIRTPNSRRTH
jgi:hypothetical protein